MQRFQQQQQQQGATGGHLRPVSQPPIKFKSPLSLDFEQRAAAQQARATRFANNFASTMEKDEHDRMILKKIEAELACLSPLSSSCSSSSGSGSSLSSSELSLSTSNSASTIVAAEPRRLAQVDQVDTTSSSAEEDEANSSSSSGVSSSESDRQARAQVATTERQERLSCEVHMIKRLTLDTVDLSLQLEDRQRVLELSRRHIMSALLVANSTGQREPSNLVSLSAMVAQQEAGTRSNKRRAIELEWFQMATPAVGQVERASGHQLVDCLREHELLIWLIALPASEAARRGSLSLADSDTGRNGSLPLGGVLSSSSAGSMKQDDYQQQECLLATAQASESGGGGGNLIGVDSDDWAPAIEYNASSDRLQALVWLCASEQDAERLHNFWLAACSLSTCAHDETTKLKTTTTTNDNSEQCYAKQPDQSVAPMRGTGAQIDAAKQATATSSDRKLEEQHSEALVATENEFNCANCLEAGKIDEPSAIKSATSDHRSLATIEIGAIAMASETAKEAAQANPQRQTIASSGEQVARGKQQVALGSASKRNANDRLCASGALNGHQTADAQLGASKSDQVAARSAPPVVKPRTSILKRKQQQQEHQLEHNNFDCKDEDEEDDLEEGRVKLPNISRASFFNRSLKLAPLSAERPKSVLKKILPSDEMPPHAAAAQSMIGSPWATKTNESQQTSVSSFDQSARLVGSNCNANISNKLTSNVTINGNNGDNNLRKQQDAKSGCGKQQIERRKSVHLIAVRAANSSCEQSSSNNNNNNNDNNNNSSKQSGLESIKAKCEKEFVISGANDRERAFERLRSRASCYDISRLMSKNTTLQSQLAKLRAAAEATGRGAPAAKDVGFELEKDANTNDTKQVAALEREDSRSGRSKLVAGRVCDKQEANMKTDEKIEAAAVAGDKNKLAHDELSVKKVTKSILKQPKVCTESKLDKQTAYEVPRRQLSASDITAADFDSDTDNLEANGDKDKPQLGRLGKFSLLRQSFNQKTLSSMLKFSSRASMRIKATVGPKAQDEEKKSNEEKQVQEERKENDSKKSTSSSCSEPKMPAIKAKKKHQQQQQETLPNQATAFMLHNQQKLQLMQRQQQQQQQLIYQQQYAAAFHQQQQFAAYVYANQFIGGQQALMLAPGAPLVTAAGPMGQPPVSMLPINHYHSQQMVSLIPQSNGRVTLKRAVSKSSMFPSQQQNRFTPMAPVTKPHSSVNILFSSSSASSSSSTTTNTQKQSKTSRSGQVDAKQTRVATEVTSGRPSFGASMRKTVKSILINKSANLNISGSQKDGLGVPMKQPQQERQLKSALKSSCIHNVTPTTKNVNNNVVNSMLALNSEGSSDGDQSSSIVDSDHSQTPRQTPAYSSTTTNVYPKSALKKIKSTDISSSTSSLGAATLARVPVSIGNISQRQCKSQSSENIDNFKRSISTRCSRRDKSPPSLTDGSSSSSSSLSNDSIPDNIKLMLRRSAGSANQRKNVTFSTKLSIM